MAKNVEQIWFDCYVKQSNRNRDPHKAFAEAMEIPRQQAKGLCYKIAHSICESNFMNNSGLHIKLKG